MKHTPRRRRGGLLSKVQSAANEIDKTAADAAEPVADGATDVQRVQVVQPPFSASDYVWAGGRGILSFLGAVRGGPVPRLLPAGHRRSLQTEDRQDRRADADEEEDQRPDHGRDQPADQRLPARPGDHEPASWRWRRRLALWWFGVDNYVIWGLLAGIFNSIPYLGPDRRHRRPGGRHLHAVRRSRARPRTSRGRRSRSPASKAGC